MQPLAPQGRSSVPSGTALLQRQPGVPPSVVVSEVQPARATSASTDAVRSMGPSSVRGVSSEAPALSSDLDHIAGVLFLAAIRYNRRGGVLEPGAQMSS